MDLQSIGEEMGLAVKRATFMRKMRRSLIQVLTLVLMVSSFSAISSNSASALDLSATDCPTVQVTTTSTVTYSRNSSFCVLEFKSGSNNFTVPAGVQSATIIVVGGGGGGGGRNWSGGGGAGGVLYGSSYPLTANSTIALSIGAGGAGASVEATNGANGGDTTFGTLTAKGGGGGAGYGWTQVLTANGVAGGSGGGSGEEDSVVAQGGASNQGTFSNVTSYGNRGGHQGAIGSQAGGGGGGAGGAGGDVPSNSSSSNRQPGAGGAGISLGAGKTFNLAAGGGGGSVGVVGAGGSIGNGGAGGNATTNGGSAAANTGSGGGGAGSPSNGGSGGSGLVVVAFAYDITYDANNATGGTAPSKQTHGHNGSTVLRTNTGTLTRTGYTFAGWNTQADGSGTSYAAGATYSTNASLNLFAQWTLNACSPSTTSSGGYTYVAFKTAGTCGYTPPASVTTIDLLVVAGGGGGASRHAGGGGAGGLINATSVTTNGSAFAITVGAGGAGGAAQSSAGTNASSGGASEVSGGGITTRTAVGGGAGSYGASAGTSGGSGGGGGNGGAGGSATSGQGNSGTAGLSDNSSYWVGGGGGGAGGAATTSSSAKAGSGGAGLEISWISSSIGSTLGVGAAGTTGRAFAGGGGGGTDRSASAGGDGGTGGGGAGATWTATPSAGTANTGGGGGGSGISGVASGSLKGGDGGSGVVVIRYINAPTISLSTSTINASLGTAVTSYTVNSTGGTVASYSISPAFSLAGLSWSSSTGLISGTPTEVKSSVTYTITATNTSGSSTATFAVSSSYTACSPTDASTGGYTILKFTTVGTCNWSIPSGVTSADILVVGGGGAGGTRAGGGGGAGGYLYFSNQVVTPSQTNTVTVGAGGVGVLADSANNGGDSSFGALTVAKGGGGGGGAVTAGDTARSGKAGGSGGGAAGNNAGNASAAIGLGTSGQGFNGGLAAVGVAWPGGGGGGSASVGIAPVSNTAAAGKGGSGTLNSITGTAVCYATGGGAGTNVGYTAGAAGDCGGAASPNGGAGTVSSLTPATPTANTGAGGGGSGWSTGADLVGGNGASGIVVFRYANTLTITYDTQGGTAITSGTTTTGGSISTSPGTPTRAGYTFNGWFAASTGGSAITFPYTHNQTANFTLFAQWSQIVNGSMLFGANANSYLTIPNSAGLKFGTGAFTIEWWQYQTDTQNWPRVFESLAANTAREIGVSIESNTFYWWSGGNALCAQNLGTGNKNAWLHFAVSRSGSTTKVFKNGTQICSFADSKDYQPTSVLKLGAEVGGGANTYFGGNITNFHWVKGTALYTANFTSSTTPTVTNANSILLLNAQNQSTFTTDLTGLNTVTNNGNNVTWSTMSPFNVSSSVATLSALSLSTGTLSPTFATGTTSYTASVSNATSSITVTPTVTQANATIQVKVGAGAYASVTSASASGSLALAVGSNTITVLVTAQDGTTTATYTVTVTRATASQTITFGSLSNKTLGSGTYAVSATASSSLAVTLTSATPLVCTISSGTITLVSAGTCTINANQAGDSSYAAATQVQQSFTVATALTITTPSGASLQGTYNTAFTSLTIASSGGAGTNSFTATGSLPAGVTLSSAGVISGTPSTAGNFALTVTVTDANGATATTSSFTIAIAKGVSSVSISVPAYTYTGSPQGPDSVTVSGSTGAVTYTYAGRLSTTYASSSTKPTNVGTYTVTATVATDSNFASVSATADFQISNAAQTAISSPVLSASSKTFPYSQTSLTVTSVTGGDGSGALSISSVADGTATGCALSGSTLTASTSGTCTLTITKAASANYNAATTTATFTFNKATQSISFTSTAPTAAKVAGSTYALTATGGASGNAVTFASTTTSVCTVATATVTFVAVGTCSISANQASTSNYAAATEATQSFLVAKGDPSLSSFANVTKLTSDSAFTLTAPTVGNALAGAFTYASGTAGTATISGATVTIVAAGTSVITATFTPTDTTNYNTATITMTLTVNRLYTISYDGNQSDGGSTPAASSSIAAGTTVTVASNSSGFTRSGFTFVAWNTSADGSGTQYVASNTFAMPSADTTLYAQWTKIKTTGLVVNLDTTNPQSLASGSTTWVNALPGISVSSQNANGNITRTSPNGFPQLNFDGNTDYYQYTNVANTRITGAMTVEMWVNPSTLTNGWNILATRWFSDTAGTAANDWHFGLYPSGGSLKLNLYTTGISNQSGSFSFTTGKWYLVGFTIDSSNNLQFYVNGQTDGNVIANASHVANTSSQLWIGDGRANVGGFIGGISKFRLYSNALSTSEMLANYNAEYATYLHQKVTLSANYGVTPSTSAQYMYRSTSTPLVANSFTRTGFIFAGWNTAADGSGTSYTNSGSISVTSDTTLYAQWTALATDATLSALTISSGTLSPTFAAATTTYTASVTNATTSITVTPTRNHANATITVNGTAVTSGSASGSISLNVGNNTITVVGTAQDGTTTASYTITVTRAGASDANLSALTISSGTLSPTFAAATTTYTASVTNATTSMTVTPTRNQANATITVNGTAVTSGSASGAISLNVGANTITVVVTAQDGTTTKSYTITITRAGSNDATMSAFTISSGTLSPTFAAATITYTATVTNATTAITVTPTRNQANATITVNGTAVTSGSASGSISLNIGNNTITVVVTAQDGTTTKTYTLTAKRLGPDTVGSSTFIGTQVAWTSNTYFDSFSSQSGVTTTDAVPTNNMVWQMFYAHKAITIPADGISRLGINTYQSGSNSLIWWISKSSSTNTVGSFSTPAQISAQTSYSYAAGGFNEAAANSAASIPANTYFIVGVTAGPYYRSIKASGNRTATIAGENVVTSINTVFLGPWGSPSGPSNGVPTALGGLLGSYTYGNGGSAEYTQYDGYQAVISIKFKDVSSMSSDATLSGLTISSGTLSPTFASSTTSYSATVTNATSSITVTPTRNNANATITVNGTAVTSGSASTAIALSVGSNTITVVGTAENGTTSTYTITVTRQAPTYTVTYNGNSNTGGSVPTDSSSPYVNGASVTVLGNSGTLVRTNFTFNGWNTAAAGTGTAYAATGSATFTMGSANVILYAQWIANAVITSFSTTSGSATGNLTQITIAGIGLAATTSLTIGNVTATIVGTPTSTQVIATLPTSTITGTKDLVLTATYNTVTIANSYESCGTSGNFFVSNNSVVGTHYCVGSVVVPEGVTTIGNCAFATAIGGNCGTTKGNLFTTVTLPNSLRTISAYGFLGATMSSIDIPEGVTAIGNSAFYMGSAYSLRIPSTVTSVNTTFYKTNATSITFAPGSGITSVTDAFRLMPNIYSIVLPDSVTTVVGTLNFSGTSFATITMRGVTSLAAGALPSTLTCIVTSANNAAVNNYSYAGFTTLPLIVTNISSCPQPTITSLSVTSGSFSGSTSTVITGTHLINTTGVTVGGNAAVITAKTTSSVTITTPAGSVGPANVVVTTEAGSVTGSNAFTYTKTLTVTLDKNYVGSTAATTTVASNATLSTPTALTRTGFTFLGWSTSSSGSVVTFPYAHGQTDNFTLYAIWSVSVQTITYAAGTGGTGTAPTTPTSVNSGSTFTTPANTYSRAGYTFAGWSDGTSVYAAGATYPTTGTVSANVTLTATWTANSLTITYDSKSGSSVSNGSVNTAASISAAPTAPTRAGYTLSGWSATDGGTVVTFPFAHGKTADFTMYAVWAANALAITYDSKSGSSVAIGSVNTGASISAAPTAPTRAGYTFAGWSATDGGTAITFPYAHGQTANFTLYAIWTANSLTVTYNSKGGTAVSNGSVNTAASISSAPTAPTRTGYTFSAWSATDGGTAITFPYAHGQTANFTLYALWTAGTLVITFDSKGGTSVSNGSTSSGASISAAPTAPTKTGYTLAGWSASDTGTVVTFPFAHGQTANFTLYAQWTGTTNTITYDSKSGSSVANGSFVTGGSISSAPTAPTRAGYTLTGWSATDGGSVITYPYSPSATSGITLYAIWAPISCSPTAVTTGGYTIYTFTTVGTCFWTVPTGLTDVEILAVAGGGGGGYSWDNTGAGGGAGGQVKTGTATLSTTLEVTVGAGGSAGIVSVTRGGTGGNSSASTVTALGGTGGCAARATTCANSAQATSLAAANGGVGGSGGASGKGGGGSNTAGTLTTTTAGGTGTVSSYSGSAVTYGVGGAGGTARGALTNIAGVAGSANTGNGGGGASAKSSSGDVNGGAGGAGLVLVRVANGNTVVFDANTGTGTMSDQNIVSGAATALTANSFTKTGYTFSGWNTNADGISGTSYTDGQSVTITAGVTLYAKWTLNTYAIVFNANSGVGTMGNQSFTHGVATILNASLYTRANYVFYRWATAADGSGTTYSNLAQVTLTAGITLYAQWTPNTYVVTYNYNEATGGNSTTTASFTTGESAIVLPTPTKTGYTFAGWFSNASLLASIGSAGASYLPTGTTLSLTAYAKWTPIDYTFTYDANSADLGTVPTETSKQITQTATVKANTGSLVRVGYTFGGWNTLSNGSGTNYLSGSLFTVGSSNVVLYAKWTANTYTVTYNVNGGTGNAQRSSTNVTSDSYTTGGSSVSIPAAGTLERSGYTFTGWNTSASGSGTSYAAGDNYTTISNVILYAKWNAVTYTITYNGNTSDGGTAPTTGGYTTGQASPYSVLTNTYTKTSNIFGGWNTAANGTGTSYSPGATITTLANIVLYATWIPQYTLHYAINGGTVTSGSLPGDQLYNSGASVGPLFSNVSRTGYRFDGWVNGASTIAGGGNFTILADSVLTAKWTPINYTISYNSDGGSDAPDPFTKQIGQSYTVGSAVFKPGYNFAGWSNGSSVVGADATVVMGSSNVSYTAQWVAKVYIVSYDWNGGRGTAVSDVSYTFGTTAITLPLVGDRVKDGYTFAGWSESSNGSALNATYIPSQSRTLYALWNVGNFTVTFDPGRGTVANSSVAVLNGGSTVLPLPTRSNFVFNGWHTAVTGGSSVGSNGATFTPTASQTIYARWIQSSLYGITESLTRIGSVITTSNMGNTFSGANSNSSVAVSIPANALPAGTTINFDLVGNSSRATGMLPSVNYLVSIALSWLTGDETVPDTAAGKPITVTISNNTIKAGAAAYAIINNVSTLLGTATEDGKITVTITSDPEIVVAATKPNAPRSVVATSNGNQQSVVSWSAPSSDGGSEITGYIVRSNTGATCTTTTTSCTISNLANGTAYTFTVEATNIVGTSTASTSASATTAALYTVTFNAKGGTTVTSGTFLTDSTVTEPTAPTRAGYSFAGWSATDGGSAVIFPYAPGVTSNITMFARWDALDNAVTFDSKGGSSVTASVFSSGGNVTEPTAPTRSGYTFAGWSATDGGSAVTFPYSPGVVTDITLFAKWAAAVVSGGGSTPAPTEPIAPVRTNVTVVAPVTVVGNDEAKIVTNEVFVPVSATNQKPAGVQIDDISKKFIADIKVVDGKLVITPVTGFSGKKTVTATITENGVDRIIQIPLTVLPENVTKPVLTPVSSSKSTIRWAASPNADAYTVYLNGKKVCSTPTTNCSVARILGPDANVEVVSNGGDSTVSQRVDADFKLNGPLLVTRVVSATKTKGALSSVDTTALYKVILLVKTQGFKTVVISKITTTKKTEPLAAARIAAIKKFISEKSGVKDINFEIAPATSNTYFNNIYVKG